MSQQIYGQTVSPWIDSESDANYNPNPRPLTHSHPHSSQQQQQQQQPSGLPPSSYPYPPYNTGGGSRRVSSENHATHELQIQRQISKSAHGHGHGNGNGVGGGGGGVDNSYTPPEKRELPPIAPGQQQDATGRGKGFIVPLRGGGGGTREGGNPIMANRRPQSRQSRHSHYSTKFPYSLFRRKGHSRFPIPFFSSSSSSSKQGITSSSSPTTNNHRYPAQPPTPTSSTIIRTFLILLSLLPISPLISLISLSLGHAVFRASQTPPYSSPSLPISESTKIGAIGGAILSVPFALISYLLIVPEREVDEPDDFFDFDSRVGNVGVGNNGRGNGNGLGGRDVGVGGVGGGGGGDGTESVTNRSIMNYYLDKWRIGEFVWFLLLIFWGGICGALGVSVLPDLPTSTSPSSSSPSTTLNPTHAGVEGIVGGIIIGVSIGLCGIALFFVFSKPVDGELEGYGDHGL